MHSIPQSVLEEKGFIQNIVYTYPQTVVAYG